MESNTPPRRPIVITEWEPENEACANRSARHHPRVDHVTEADQRDRGHRTMAASAVFTAILQSPTWITRIASRRRFLNLAFVRLERSRQFLPKTYAALPMTGCSRKYLPTVSIYERKVAVELVESYINSLWF